MAEPTKGADNRLYQLIVVLITTIVGPLIVFFVTNSAKNPAPAAQPTVVQAAATVANVSATATSPAASAITPTTAAATNAQPTATLLQPTATTFGIQNPKGTVPAGTPALVDNLSLWINAEDVKVEGQYIRISLHIRNLSGSTRALTFSPAAITVKDDAGKTYNPYMGAPKAECRKDKLTQPRTVQLGAQAELVLQSTGTSTPAQWCADGSDALIPMYTGPKDAKPQVLRITVNKLGPFSGFTLEVGM